jgi:DNA processing protein
VNSDLDKGGTWAGVTEQLEKLQMVPVYVRSTGESSAGLEALQKKGALPWPNPQDPNSLGIIFGAPVSKAAEAKIEMSLFPDDMLVSESSLASDPQPASKMAKPDAINESAPSFVGFHEDTHLTVSVDPEAGECLRQSATCPADALIGAVREIVRQLLRVPMKDREVAVALQISTAQAKVWLQRFVDEGLLEKLEKPAGYVIRQTRRIE